MNNENHEGYVYILTNPSFREDWVKIGKSSRPVDVRSKELDNTAVPLPFEIYATLKTAKFNKVEKQIHKQIDRLTDLRIRQNREFFNIAPSVALDIMRDIADLLDDSELAVYAVSYTHLSEANGMLIFPLPCVEQVICTFVWKKSDKRVFKILNSSGSRLLLRSVS